MKTTKILINLTAVLALAGCSLFGGGGSEEPLPQESVASEFDFGDTSGEEFGEFADSGAEDFAGEFSDFSDDLGEDFGSEDFFAEEGGDFLGEETSMAQGTDDFSFSDEDFFANETEPFDTGAAGTASGSYDDVFASDFDTGFGPATGFNEITNIEYLSFEGGGTLVIETASPAEYRTRRNPAENQLVIELPGVTLPKRFERPYITRDFQQQIGNVMAYYDSPTGETRVVVQMIGNAQFNVEATGSKIVLSPEILSSPVARSSQTGQQDSDSSEAADADATSAAETLANNLGEVVKFRGKPINIEVDDADIRGVLRLIAEQAGINLIIDETVSGNISLKLREVPWDQALALILKTKQFGFSRQGSVLRITTQDRLAEEQAKQRRLLDERVLGEPMKVRVVTVSYAKVEELVEQVTSVLSQRGKVVVDPRTASLVISDVEEYLERADRLVKSLDVAPRQVLIEGKVIEARETFTRDIGVNLALSGTTFESGQVGFNMNTRNTPVNRTSASAISGLGLDLTAGTFENIGDLNAFLSLFEREEKINVISSPRVVTLNNKEAEISQNTQIPIIVVQPGNPPTFTTEFKDIKLMLKVLPQITFEGNVILQVEVLREFPDAEIASQGVAINSRSATTTVLVPNGQTAVIGGIYQSDAIKAEQGAPWLKNIPLLGHLFKSTSNESVKNELLIFLTPRILKDLSPRNNEKLLSEVK